MLPRCTLHSSRSTLTWLRNRRRGYHPYRTVVCGLIEMIICVTPYPNTSRTEAAAARPSSLARGRSVRGQERAGTYVFRTRGGRACPCGLYRGHGGAATGATRRTHIDSLSVIVVWRLSHSVGRVERDECWREGCRYRADARDPDDGMRGVSPEAGVCGGYDSETSRVRRARRRLVLGD